MLRHALACLFALALAAPTADAAPRSHPKRSTQTDPAQAGSAPASSAQTAGSRDGGAGNLPPHAWLFGTWTGGLFPVPDGMTSVACFSQPVLIVTRDLVLRAVVTDQHLDQRVIETARSTPAGVAFRFISVAATPPAPDVLGMRIPSLPSPAAGAEAGCEDPDGLLVERRGSNAIVLLGCADFAYPLVRCG